MKYCPYCGASLVDDVVSFCSECGKELPHSNSKEVNEEKEPKAQKSIPAQKLTKKKKRPPQENTETLPNETEKNDPSYDGYYDDIVPSDIGKHREGIDWVMMKRVGLVAIGVVLIISLCVAAMYLL